MIPNVTLALQGGGTHGAFTWGVLDRLLDDVHGERLTISALSGSSAGAVNAALCAHGLSTGPSQAASAPAAKRMLDQFWRTLSQRAFFSGNALLGSTGNALLHHWNLDWSPVAIGMEIASLVFSPYDAPFYSNPLLPLLDEFLPPGALGRVNSGAAPALYVCATSVATNRRRIFSQPDITIASLLASACIPCNFRAIEIDGDSYWDGGFLGNPALAPLLTHGTDIMIVSVNPQHLAAPMPRSARAILDRLNDIHANAPLVLELNAIHAVNKLLERIPPDHRAATGFREVHVHVIADDALMEPLGFASKGNASPAFLHYLFDSGRATAQRWLEHHYDKLGQQSSCDWKAEFNLEQDLIDPVLKGGKTPQHNHAQGAHYGMQ